MKAVVNKDVCIACETCPEVCPEIFSMDDDGKAVAISGEIPADLEESAEEARDTCPVAAIEID